MAVSVYYIHSWTIHTHTIRYIFIITNTCTASPCDITVDLGGLLGNLINITGLTNGWITNNEGCPSYNHSGLVTRVGIASYLHKDLENADCLMQSQIHLP